MDDAYTIEVLQQLLQKAPVVMKRSQFKFLRQKSLLRLIVDASPYGIWFIPDEAEVTTAEDIYNFATENPELLTKY